QLARYCGSVLPANKPQHAIADTTERPCAHRARRVVVLPGRRRLRRAGLVGQLGVVHMQRPAHGLTLLVRQWTLCATARPALRKTAHWPYRNYPKQLTTPL